MNPLSPPNVCEYADTYIKMNPARASVPEFLSRSPPLQYEAAMAADNETLYDEIPGEHLIPTFSTEKNPCGDVKYANVPSSSGADSSEVTLKPQEADKEETSDPNKSESANVPSSSEADSSEVTLKPQEADKEETSDPNESESAYVMD